MKHTVIVFVFCLLLSACSPTRAPTAPVSEPQQVPISQSEAPPLEAGETPQETLEQYFELQYEAYTSLQDVDVSHLLDMSQLRNRSAAVWLRILNQRRRLIDQHDLCYVETGRYPYAIAYDETPEDDRMEFWKDRDILTDDTGVTLHFRITGEADRAYPPGFAVNSQHTMRLKQVNGRWIITFHYYPGSVRRYGMRSELTVIPEEEMLAELKEEFRKMPDSQAGSASLPAGAVEYDGSRAAQYAKRYTEAHNPIFYQIGDWMGNCANFISQSIWYGFGGESREDVQAQKWMTNQWYAGGGGGSPAWENVKHFWSYATASKSAGLVGDEVPHISQLELGGIIQVQTRNTGSGQEDYNHSLMLVDKDTLLLSQNSPDCFVYYSDLVNADARYFNPRFLR